MRKMLIVVIVIAAIVRLWYIDYSGSVINVMPDSQGYHIEWNFFKDDFIHNFFNTNRTPGYTMLTSLAMDITIGKHPLYKSPDFYRGTWIIIIIQTVLGLIGLIILFDLLIAIGIPKIASAAFTAFTATNMYQFIWERAFLTEALYIFILTVLMRLFVSLLKKPLTKIGIVFILLAVYGFWIRPAGLLIPFILLPIVFIVHRTKKVLFLVLALLCFYTAIPTLHLVLNRQLYNFKGLSINTDFSVFGRILLFDLPIDAAKSVQPLHSQIVSYKAIDGNVSIPWYFFVYFNNEIYGHMDDLQKFNRLVIRKEPLLFAQTVIEDIPKAFFDTNVYEVLYRSPTPSVSQAFFDTLSTIYGFVQQSTIIFLLLFPFSIWLFIKKQSVQTAFLFGIAMIELYQLFSSLIFGGAWEFARHMLTTQTFLFFFCFWWITRCIRWVGKYVIK